MAEPELQATLERILALMKTRMIPNDRPLYHCICRDTGWIDIDTEGRGTVRRCEKCGGPPIKGEQRERRRGFAA